MSDRLFGAPLEAVPLYAALAVLHDWSAGLPANTCLGSSAVTIEALRLLGFDAKMLTAYVEVHRTGQSDGAPLETVGRPDGDAVALPNGSSIDGHVVVWAESFGRMVDSSLMQLPRLRAAADDNEIQLLPLITPMDKAQLLASRMGLQRDPYLIVYRVFESRLGNLAPALSGQNRQVFEYGGLSLAGTTVKLLRTLADYRDLRALHQMYPTLRELLTERRSLPPLPAEPRLLQQMRQRFPEYDR